MMDNLVTNAEQLVDELTGLLRDAHRVLAKARAAVLRNAEGGKYAEGEGRFITVRGHAIFIPQGKDVGEAITEHFDRVKSKGEGEGHADSKSGGEPGNGPHAGASHAGATVGGHVSAAGEHGAAGAGHGTGGKDHGEHGHGGHAGHDPLEHAGHQAHAAQDIAAVHEALGRGHAAHAAIHDAHHAAEAAHAAGEVGHHGAGPLDAAAIGVRHLYGPALKASAALMSKVPGLRRLAGAVKAVHEGAVAVNQKITEGLISRYGKATAGAILGVGSAMSHTVSHGIGLHGPAASALPGPHLIGAMPFIAAAEVGKRLGLVGNGTKLERGLGVAGGWLHGLMGAAGKGAGKVTGKAATAGLTGAHAAGRLTGKIIRGAKWLTGNELTELTLYGRVVIDADSLDVWNAAAGAWVNVDDLAEQAGLTENELSELLDFVANAEPEDE